MVDFYLKVNNVLLPVLFSWGEFFNRKNSIKIMPVKRACQRGE